MKMKFLLAAAALAPLAVIAVENFSKADKNGDGYLDNAEYDEITKKR